MEMQETEYLNDSGQEGLSLRVKGDRNFLMDSSFLSLKHYKDVEMKNMILAGIIVGTTILGTDLKDQKQTLHLLLAINGESRNP